MTAQDLYDLGVMLMAVGAFFLFVALAYLVFERWALNRPLRLDDEPEQIEHRNARNLRWWAVRYSHHLHHT